MTSTQNTFWQTNVGKTLKALIYVGGSAVLAYLISLTTSTPDLFGPLTAVINIAAVYVKTTFFDSKTPNLGAK